MPHTGEDERLILVSSPRSGADSSHPPPRATMEPWMLLMIVFAIAVILTALYLIDPAESRFGPPCVLNAVTGLHCPGCGGTRAAHALLHGDVRQAAAWNILALLIIPLFAAYGVYGLVMFVRHRRMSVPRLPRRAVLIVAIVFFAYLIARNLPFAPFTALAPHPLPRAESPADPEG